MRLCPRCRGTNRLMPCALCKSKRLVDEALAVEYALIADFTFADEVPPDYAARHAVSNEVCTVLRGDEPYE